MRHRFSTLLAVAIMGSLSLQALAAGPCEFGAYSSDPDPAGANVRSGPGTQYPVIGVLTPDANDAFFTPEFRVTDFQDGWFKIGDAVVGQFTGGPEVTVFEGPGWISAKLAAFDIQDPHLYEGPSASTAVTHDLTDWWTTGTVSVSAIHDCQRGFVHLTVTNDAGSKATGWATNLCGNQATTCS
jgi:hypothetical protein